MWQDVLVAVSLVLVIEGILPFLSPSAWRTMVLNVAQMNNRSLRTMGLVSMLIGVVLLHWIK